MAASGAGLLLIGNVVESYRDQSYGILLQDRLDVRERAGARALRRGLNGLGHDGLPAKSAYPPRASTMFMVVRIWGPSLVA